MRHRQGRRDVPQVIAVASDVYAKTRHRAQSRGQRFTLPFVAFIALLYRPCIYCGCKSKNVHTRAGAQHLYTGLDRLDPSKGYTLTNVVPCCAECNRVKSNVLTPAEMLLAMKEIQKFRKKSLSPVKR